MATYNGVRLYENQSNVYTLAEIDTTKTIGAQEEQTTIHTFTDFATIVSPTWNLTTILMTKYTSNPLNLSASNISTGNNEIVGYRIMREQQGKLFKVADITTSDKVIYDYCCPNDTLVKYYFFPKEEISDGVYKFLSPIVSEEMKSEWASWSVIGTSIRDDNEYIVDEENIWTFYVNIDSGTMAQQNKRIQHDTYDRFPKLSVGKQRYLKSDLKCWLGNIVNNTTTDNMEKYVDDVALMEKWEEFANNGKLKLLKDIKGRTIPIDIVETKFDYIDEIPSQPVELSFSYEQITLNENITIYNKSNSNSL